MVVVRLYVQDIRQIFYAIFMNILQAITDSIWVKNYV